MFAWAVETYEASASSMGISRTTERESRTMLPVQILPMPGAPLPYQQLLIWHERTHRDPGALAFRELVSQVMGCPWQPALT